MPESEPSTPETSTADSPLPLSPRGEFFRRHAWLVFLGPLIGYMLVPMAFDTGKPGDHLTETHRQAAEERYASQLVWKATAMAATLVPIVVLLAVGMHWPPVRVSCLAIAVGVVGVVLWVGVDAVGLRQWASSLFAEGSRIGGFLFPERDATDPFEIYGAGTPRFWWFMTTRFIGLALIVPLVEELMLRGWLMRMVHASETGSAEFWRVPFGEVSMRAAAIGVGFEVLIHPEKLAAVVWFSLTTWLMFRTKNFWDCVAAHAVTNFLLGVWVLWSGQWELW